MNVVTGANRVNGVKATVRAQAKLNLRLEILAREASGYHAIETIFHRVELADDVTVELRDAGERTVTCTADVGPAEENLAYRAAAAYLEAAGWDAGFAIHIEKRIPAGGGLGGGSADAGATLRALNALAPTPLPPAALLAIAARLGADVPFLTSDAAMALAWGRGTRLLALDPLPQRHVALVLPSFRVATAEAYRWIAEAHEGRAAGPVELRPWHLLNWEELAPWAANDFEAVVALRHPEVHAGIAALRDAGAAVAGMSGSGSTLFGIFDAPPPIALLEARTGARVVATRTAAGVDAVHRFD